MNLTPQLLDEELYLAAHLLYLLLAAVALWGAPWRLLLRDRENLHTFLGAGVLLMFLWRLDAGLLPGLHFHLLGATLLVLMFGWQFALINLSLVLAGITLATDLGWAAFGINALLMVALPVLFSFALYRLTVRYLPHHFFVYVLVNGFLCAILSMALTLTAATLLLLCCSDYTLETLGQKYLPFAPMMLFAEGFFTGMLTTSLVLFRPEWIGSFSDRRYLKGK